jgi:hypothetical protein
MAMTPKKMIALEVREDPLAEESPAYPKLLEHATPKTLKALEVREGSLIESPEDPELEPPIPIDPRVKPKMVQIRTEAYPSVIKACPSRGKARV